LAAIERGTAPAGETARPSLFGQLTMILNVVGTLLIVAITLLTNVDVIGRTVFNQPVPGVPEMVALSIVAIVFLQMANTLREDRHITSDVIMVLVKRRWPRVATACYALFNLIGAVLLALIAWYTLPIFRDAYLGSFYRGTQGVFTFPLWPIHGIVILGASATFVQFMIFFARDLGRALFWHRAGA
jgi:TRAP-type C4-dicarboxylate transport system permease small subunit